MCCGVLWWWSAVVLCAVVLRGRLVALAVRCSVPRPRMVCGRRSRTVVSLTPQRVTHQRAYLVVRPHLALAPRVVAVADVFFCRVGRRGRRGHGVGVGGVDEDELYRHCSSVQGWLVVPMCAGGRLEKGQRQQQQQGHMEAAAAAAAGHTHTHRAHTHCLPPQPTALALAFRGGSVVSGEDDDDGDDDEVGVVSSPFPFGVQTICARCCAPLASDARGEAEVVGRAVLAGVRSAVGRW